MCQLSAAVQGFLAESWHTATPTCHTFRRSVTGVATDPRQTLGQTGEQLACEHLERRGYTLLERNFRTRWGELDIVAFDGACTIIFCEVKTRRGGGRRAVTPLESVHPRKRSQVRRMAGSWLAARRERPHVANLRFDAIGVTLDSAGALVELVHLEGAF